VIWILILDQAIFALMDLALGRAADRVLHRYGRIGPWLLVVAAVSCVAFLLLSHLGAWPGGAALSMVCIVVWVATSSVLRAPPWLMLAKHAATPSMPMLAALNLTGLALGGAVAPYLSLSLKSLAPALPFAVMSIVLLVTTAILVHVERMGLADGTRYACVGRT
jgi:Na+/melibiose symporter-like transporter